MAIPRGNTIELGRSATSGESLFFPPDARNKHLYITGGTGTGKSKLLEWLIRQDIKAWPKTHCGLLLLDDHGAVYDGIMAWLAESGAERPIIPIDLRRDDAILSYNVLRQRPVANASVVVDNFVDAMSYVWGQSGTDQTPLFARWAANTLRALYERGLTLADAVYLIDHGALRLRRAITQGLSDRIAARDWDYANSLTRTQFDDQIGSTLNRLGRFVRNPLFCSMLGQTEVSLDLSAALKEGHIILVRLGREQGRISGENADTFATVILNDLWTAAQERGGKHLNPKPFYVYLDEFQKFVSPTIAENLDEARGFGLHVTMANQFPGQLLTRGNAGKQVYDSIMETATTKAVFRLTHDDNLEPMAKWLFRGTMDPSQIKNVMYSTKVMEYRREFMRGTAVGETVTEGESTYAGDSHGASALTSFGEAGLITNSVMTHQSQGSASSDVRGSVSGSTSSYSTSRSMAQSKQEALVPVLGKEMNSVEYRSLDEQLFLAMAMLFDQRERHFVVRIGDRMRVPVALKTPTVRDGAATPERVERYADACRRMWPFFLHATEAKERLARREQNLLADVSSVQASNNDDAMAPKTFGRKIKRDDLVYLGLESMKSSNFGKMHPNGQDPSARLDIQPRDIEVLRGLFESRALNVNHTASLYFSGKREAAKKRLQKLKAANLIRVRPRESYEASIYHLSAAGFRLLRDTGSIEDYPRIDWADQEKRSHVSDLTLRHELAVMDVKVAFFEAATTRPDLTIAQFSTWPTLYQFKACPDEFGHREIDMKPDGYIRLHHSPKSGGTREYPLFLEVDRSTESLDKLTQKAACYLDYYRTGGLAKRHGQPAENFRDFRFRVLMILLTQERLKNVMKKLLDAPAPTRSQIWLTTMKEITRPFDEIWRCPRDERASVTLSDSTGQRGGDESRPMLRSLI